MNTDNLKKDEIWVEIGPYENIPVNTGKTIRFQGQEVALFRLSSGKVKAIQNRCPHKNGVLAEGIVCDDHVFCPLHDQKIHLPSGLVQAPDTGCVKTYPVSVRDNKVYIAFSNTKEAVS